MPAVTVAGPGDLTAVAAGRAVAAGDTAAPQPWLTCLGDSHVWVFQHVGRLVGREPIEVVGVGGATAFGLANPNSATNALEVFRSTLAGVPLDRPLVVLLGEIDCGFLVWLRAADRETSVTTELADSFRRYTAFLGGLLDAGRSALVVMTVPLPTIVDYPSWGGLANARSRVTASLRERTDATRWYNAALRAWSQLSGVAVLDVEPDLLDPGTGLVRPAFRHPDPDNHHYAATAFAPVVARRLADLPVAGLPVLGR